MATFDYQPKTSVFVRVSPIQSTAKQSKLCDKLWIYFQRKRVSQGSEVQDVRVLSSDDEALWLGVTFDETSGTGVKAVLSLNDHEVMLEGKTIRLHVQSYFPEPAPPIESDSDIEIITWDGLHIQDDESGKAGHWPTEDRPGDASSSRHEGNPFGKPAASKPHQSGFYQTETYTPHRATDPFEMTCTPTCLAQSPVLSPTVHVTASQSSTPVKELSPSMSQPISSAPAGSSTVPPVPPNSTASSLSSESTNTMADVGIWDYRTPLTEILSSTQQNTQSQGGTQTSNIGATDAGPNLPSNQMPSTVPGIWSTTPRAAGVQTSFWGGFEPSNPWRQPVTQHQPGFQFTTGLGRGGTQTSNISATDAGPDIRFPPSNQMPMPGIWSLTPEAAGVQTSLRRGFEPSNPWHQLVTQPPPGFHFTGLGRGVFPRGITGPQPYHRAGIQPSQIHEFPLGMTSQFGMPEAPNLPDGNSARDKIAPSARQLGLNERVPGTAVGATPAHEDNPVPTKEKKTEDDQGEGEEKVNLVEVTDFKSTTSEEFLRLYFENPRKSRGGEIDNLEKDAKTGVIQIKYSDPSVAKAVTEKTHSLGGVNLTVRLVVKRKTRPRPLKKRCLFLSGIPDGCTLEHLQLYIENCSGMDEPEITYGEKPGTALCTFAEDIPDPQKVTRKICSKKLQNTQLTVEEVQESDCILVQGLTNKTTLEFIELYFDNQKKSGGGGVREVLPGSAEDQAIVYFEDWKVVADVLSKKGHHKVGNTKVLVEEYHDCLGRLSALDVPTPHIPKPISVQVPQNIMEFIFGGKGKKAKKKLAEELKNVGALLRWPDGDKKTAARLEPLEEDRQPQSSWLNWSQLCGEVLTGFLKGCRAIEVQVPGPLWKEASAKLAKITATQICSVVPDDHTHSVRLVGEQRDVDVVAADIQLVIKDLQAKANHDAQQTKEEMVMSPDKLKLFTQCGIRRKMERMFPDLKITIVSLQGQMGLILEGTRKKVQEAELCMRRHMDGLNIVEFKTGRGKTEFIGNISDKIHEILSSKDIHAACSISTDGKIKIHGSSKKDTSLAKMYIDQEVDEDVISISGPAVIAVLKGQDGARLVAGINNKKFAMVVINYQSGNIELAGFRNELKETKKQILEFLRNTVKVKDTIRTNRSNVRLITSSHGQELTGFTAKHQRDSVTILPQLSGRNAGFLVEGNEEGLKAARQFVSQLVARIKEQPYPVSKIGMVQRFRETKGKTFLLSVEKELECVIDVIGENESEDEVVEGATASPSLTKTTEVLCRISLPGGCTLRVCKGDLTKQTVDCIVNAANVDLKHMGGLAAAILQAGGQIIQTECDQILKKKDRPLYVGEPVCTSSGNLLCKKIIHVAGPWWDSWKKTTDDQPTHEEHLLFDGVDKCLQLANRMKMQSIAIPAISTGVYGFPTKLAAVQIVEAVVEFNKKVSSLMEINLTNHDQKTCDVMKQVVMDQLGHLVEEDEPSPDVTTDFPGFTNNPTGAHGSWMPDDEPTVVTPKFTSSGSNSLTTNEGVKITLMKGSIAEEKADVIVNTSGSDLNLSLGLVSQAIVKAAGPALQQECDQAIAAGGKVHPGSFVETGAAAMTSCKKIFHCVIDRYHSSASEKPLGDLVESLLEQAEIIEVFSLAIPALGTGNLGYPANVTARVMYEAVAAFSSQHPRGVLKDIRFVVYDKDLKTIKGFEDEIERLTTVASKGAAPAFTQKRKLRKSTSMSTVGDRHSYSQLHRDSAGTLQSKIGPVCLQICQGDLVKEKSNVIVNSVGEKLDLQGPVSAALLAKGGNKIRKECDALRKKDPSKSVYVTKAGKLNCNSIFHVVTPTTPEEIKSIVTKTLQKAEETQVKSISFPALGTGPQARQAVGPSASAMLASIGEFVCGEKPRYLLLIRLVIFKPEMLPAFEAALKQEEGHSYKKQASLLSRSLGWARSVLTGATAEDASDDESLPETIILHICAMDDVTIKKATDKIDAYQDEQFASEDMPDSLDMIAKMSEEHHAELRNIEKKYNVQVRVELSKGHAKFFRVQGLTIDVKDARFSIQEMFTRMQVQETAKQHSKHLTKEVQWKYSSADGLEDYDADINVIIEEAYQRKQPSVAIDLEEGRVTIDFGQMQERSRGGTLSVNRVDLQQASKFETPSSWIPMKKGEHFQTVKLAAGTQEYTDVETRFRTSMGPNAPIQQIDEILRIQNIDLMMQYQARKAGLVARLGRTDIEETLYHGTDEQTCDKINKFGFNRSFCGKNATVHGKGVYFAAEASFSARAIYAIPNASNTKHIYTTKVLVGDFTTGAQGMVVPPNKPNNPDQLYDCVVDNMAQPSIYVIFHDAQAYAEHLIKYK